MDDSELRPTQWRDGVVGECHGADLVRFLATMPAAFCLLDGEWRFRYVNPEAERLLDRPGWELVGTSLWDVFRGVRGGVEAASRSAVTSGEAVTVEAPDTHGGWCEVRAWPGQHGLVVHLLDVTSRRRAEDDARRATVQAALLTEVTAELSGAGDTASALARLAELVVPTLADACIVTVVDRSGRARDVGSWHADPERRALIEEYTRHRLDTLPSDSPVAQALATGTPVTESVTTVLELMRPGPARELLRALAPASAVVLPLVADAGPVGVLTLYQDDGRVMGAQEMETAWQVAVQAGQAVARVHRQSQQALLAEALQRSLLTDPPHIRDASIVVRYVPAAEAARVGGDWYDAFLQRDGVPMLVIGDVAGHDTAAAAAMGQLRGLLRGIAHHSGAGPAEILRGLDEAIVDMHADTLATAAVARVEKADRPAGAGWSRLRWTNAGHPPPVSICPDGTVSVLGGPVGDLLLGIDPTVVRSESVTDLEPGTTVLLYTDGLIERRGNTLDEGMTRLTGYLRELAGHPLEELCDAVLERMLRGTPQDDVALVAVRLAPVLTDRQ